MSRKKFSVLFLALLMLFSSFISPGESVFAKVESEKISKNSVGKEDKISNSVIESFKDKKDFYDVIVILKAKASFNKVKQESRSYNTGESQEIKERKAVVGELKEVAIKSQENLTKYLDNKKLEGSVKEYENFFIINAISLTANREVIEEIATFDEVEIIEPNEKIKRDEPIPVIRRQRRSIDQKEIEWNLKMIGADKAWEKFQIKGNGVTVGIIDSAVDLSHIALKEKFRGYDSQTKKFTYEGNYKDFIDGAQKPTINTDVMHGSHCMGIVLGSEKSGEDTINAIGVAPEAKFISARVFSDDGNSTAEGFIKAAQWMLAPGGDAAKAPQIINNSWGGGHGKATWFEKSLQSWREANILPVFASGNMGFGEPEPGPGSISSPASSGEAFAVGAVDKDSKLAFFSKRGPSPLNGIKGYKPEISAPGVSVRSAVRGGYSYMSGTSMAAPHVTGTAALVKSANSSLSARQIQKILEETAVPATDSIYNTSPNHGYGYGIVNAYQAVNKAIGNGRGRIFGNVKSSSGEKISAEISIEESGRKVQVDDETGYFEMQHPEGKFTLKCISYGHEPFEKEIDIEKDNRTKIDITLTKKNTADIKVNVSDNKSALENVYVRILEDSSFDILKTDDSGLVEFKNVPEGSYTIKFFKDGYEVKEEKIQITNSTLIELKITLDTEQAGAIKKEISYDNGKINGSLDQNYPIGARGYVGGAVQIVPDKKGGIISDVSVQTYDQYSPYQGKEALISIKRYDERGRLYDIMSPKKVQFELGDIINLDVEHLQIKADSPYYVMIEQTQRGARTFVVAADRNGDREHSFIFYDNNFFPIEKEFPYGALMIRSSIKYKDGAEDFKVDVPKPILYAIDPDIRIIKGKAAPNQNIQIVIREKIKMDMFADDNGEFSFNIRQKLRPGEEVLAYGKNFEGLKSEVVKGIVLTRKKEIRETIKVAEKYKDSGENLEKEKELQNNLKTIYEKLKEIEEYEKSKDIDGKRIISYQDEIDILNRSLKENVLDLSIEKKELKIALDNAEQELKEIWISVTGREVPSTKEWMTTSNWSTYNLEVLRALSIYEKVDASETEIKRAIQNLKNAKLVFDSCKNPGKKKVFEIDKRFENGIYNGEGRGKNLLANHVTIQIQDGKLIDLKITEWYDSEASKKAILESGFIEKIIESGRLDVKPIKGYDMECESIFKAIIQAAEKALKSGEKSDVDLKDLREKIAEAKELLNKYPVSKDGRELDDGAKWVTETTHNEFKNVIVEAENTLNTDKVTNDLKNKAIILLETAKRNFVAAIQDTKKEIEEEVEYRDDDYTILESGHNPNGKNKFIITIKDGKISKIEIVEKEWADTEGFDKKLKNGKIIDRIIQKNSPDVEVVTGATASSNSLKRAVTKALEEAKKPKENNDTININQVREELKNKIFEAKELLYMTKIGKDDKKDLKYWIEIFEKQKYIRKVRAHERVLKEKEDDLNAIVEEVKKITDTISEFNKIKKEVKL